MKQLNKSIHVKSIIIIPALDRYIKQLTEDNWNDVLWGLQKYRDQINKAVLLAMDYDSNFFDKNGRLVEFIDFVDKDTPKTKRIQSQVFTNATHIWQSNSQTAAIISSTLVLPPIEQVKIWSEGFVVRTFQLRDELVRLIDLLQTDN